VGLEKSTTEPDTDHVQTDNVRVVPRTDVRHLRYFVAVAEECHFGRAAARLHVTTPPLSQRIRELEEDLGLSLFERTSRKVTLTPAGERLLVEARDVLRAMERFDAVSAEIASSVSLPLRVGFCHGSEGGVMRAIRALLDEQPDLAVRPDGLTSLHILEGLRTGALAVGIVRAPVGDPERIASVPLARVPVDHVAVPASHRLADRSEVDVRDLDGEPVFVVDRGDAPTAHDEIAAYCTSMGVRPAWVTHAPTQVERVLDLVAVGGGIGWLNSWQVEREATHSGVVVKPLRPVGLYDEFRVAWRVGDTATATSTFVRVVLETCGS
jgi:DNA-binding transcriptional LysR family regulator